MSDKYYISKLSFADGSKRVDSVRVYSYRNNVLRDEGSKDREWLVSHIQNNYEVYVMDKNEKGNWIQRNQFSYENNYLHWGIRLPRNIEKRNVFISFRSETYDKCFKNRLERILDDLIINQSVHDGDILPDNSADYIKHLIQQGYLKDTTVQIVLIGNHTKNRKHVDWEIYGALDKKVGNRYAGILGLILPNHPDFGKSTVNYALMPNRLAANYKSGYAVVRHWTSDRRKLQDYIEEAFAMRSRDDLIVNREIPQMKKNLTDD